MNPIAGIDAMRLSRDICKLPGGRFTLAFYQYNRTKGLALPKLRIEEGCTFRSQLPQDEFSVDSDNFFLFNDKDGKPKTCYRILARFIAFPPDFILRKINWLHHE